MNHVVMESFGKIKLGNHAQHKVVENSDLTACISDVSD